MCRVCASVCVCVPVCMCVSLYKYVYHDFGPTCLAFVSTFLCSTLPCFGVECGSLWNSRGRERGVEGGAGCWGNHWGFVNENRCSAQSRRPACVPHTTYADSCLGRRDIRDCRLLICSPHRLPFPSPFHNPAVAALIVGAFCNAQTKHKYQDTLRQSCLDFGCLRHARNVASDRCDVAVNANVDSDSSNGAQL